ncbi:cation:proton antiporter domain-containing protein [Nocardioides sp. B-3]|uniref:cation:proton antiporter domain-containing protein n=1 Tax=Nocardioides sp. B-3 TaxID=2895565 RepID=UPI003FA5E0DE
MGVLLGEAGLGIEFEDAQLAHALGFGALALIPAEGGLTTNWREMRPSIKLGVSLATVGVAISVAVVAVGAHFLLGLPRELAILLGAVCSPTDAAAVFSVLRVVPLPKRLTGALEAESGLNDAPTVVPGLGHLHGRSGRERAAGGVWPHRLRARRRCPDRSRGRLRRRPGDAPHRAAVLGSLPARGPLPGLRGVRRSLRPCTPPASRPSTSPR